MRPIKRIDKMMTESFLTKMAKRWQTFNLLPETIGNKIEDLRKEWHKCPDMRLGQFLIVKNILPDDLKIWTVEDMTLLIEEREYIADILTWTSYYNADETLRKEPITRFINQLDTDHLFRLSKLAYVKETIHYNAIIQELIKRYEEEWYKDKK